MLSRCRCREAKKLSHVQLYLYNIMKGAFCLKVPFQRYTVCSFLCIGPEEAADFHKSGVGNLRRFYLD